MRTWNVADTTLHRFLLPRLLEVASVVLAYLHVSQIIGCPWCSRDVKLTHVPKWHELCFQGHICIKVSINAEQPHITEFDNNNNWHINTAQTDGSTGSDAICDMTWWGPIWGARPHHIQTPLCIKRCQYEHEPLLVAQYTRLRQHRRIWALPK